VELEITNLLEVVKYHFLLQYGTKIENMSGIFFQTLQTKAQISDLQFQYILILYQRYIMKT
jgi:hypothetical protein